MPHLDEPGECPDDEADEGADETWTRPVDRFRRSATGSVVAAGLLGLRDALEGRPEREEVTIVTEAPTRSVDERLEVRLDYEHPERSIAIVRPATEGEAGEGRTGE
jgi:hypothetical protein